MSQPVSKADLISAKVEVLKDLRAKWAAWMAATDLQQYLHRGRGLGVALKVLAEEGATERCKGPANVHLHRANPDALADVCPKCGAVALKLETAQGEAIVERCTTCDFTRPQPPPETGRPVGKLVKQADGEWSLICPGCGLDNARHADYVVVGESNAATRGIAPGKVEGNKDTLYLMLKGNSDIDYERDDFIRCHCGVEFDVPSGVAKEWECLAY